MRKTTSRTHRVSTKVMTWVLTFVMLLSLIPFGAIQVAEAAPTLLTQEDPAHVQRVARYVDRRLREAAITSRAGDATAWALASMTLADELFRAQDENVRLKKELAALSKPE